MVSDKGTRTSHHVPTNPIVISSFNFPPLSIPTTHSSMNPSFINGSHKADPNSFWKWKGINTAKKKRSRQNSVTKFLQESSKKIEAAALGPGGGAGIGCGVGIGFGLVGGVGYGGGPWNHLRMAFGIGMGCGAGLGIGFGQGIGVGFSMDSLQSYLSEEKSDSNKRVLIPI